MTTEFPPAFARQSDSHLKHLKLKGLQPKTIDAYSRAIRRLGGYFDYRIDALSEAQLTEYFSDLIGTHSWSAVKLDLYGLKFFTQHVLKQPWATVQSFCLKGLIALLHLVLRITPLSAPPTDRETPAGVSLSLLRQTDAGHPATHQANGGKTTRNRNGPGDGHVSHAARQDGAPPSATPALGRKTG